MDDSDASTQLLFEEGVGSSIASILARHPRERLFVQPVLWDSRQVALLGCRFLPPDVSVSAPPRTGPAPPKNKRGGNTAGEARCLHWLSDSDKATGYLSLFLDLAWLERRRAYIGRSTHLAIKGQLVGELPYYYVERAEPKAVACVSRELINTERRKLVGRKSRKSRNPLRASIMLRHVTPAEDQPDPCVAAILIGFAQQLDARRRKGDQKPPLRPDDGVKASPVLSPISVTVVVVERDLLRVCSAEVPSEFLGKLLDLNAAPKTGSSVEIAQKLVPYKPYNTLAARFIPLLTGDKTALEYAERLRGERVPGLESGS